MPSICSRENQRSMFSCGMVTAKKTGRVVIPYEAPRTGGFGGEIAAIIAERAIEYLEAPIARVAGFDVFEHQPDLPLSGNLHDGEVTAGYFQYDRVTDGDEVAPAEHWNTTWSPEATLQIRTFLSTGS